MGKILRPINYEQLLNPTQTEQGIKQIKDFSGNFFVIILS